MCLKPIAETRIRYWGNCYMAGAQLSDDMLSIRKETITDLTPEGGTLEDYEYREGTYVQLAIDSSMLVYDSWYARR